MRGHELTPELEPYAERARLKLPLVERFTREHLLNDLDATRRDLRRRALVRRQAELNAMLRALGDDADAREWTDQLIEVAKRLGEIDQLPPERERAATG